jgi:hypothetical protein
VKSFDLFVAHMGEGQGQILTVDNVGLDYSHGETVVRHGIQTKQLKEGDTFIAFDGAYRWRSGYIEESFD